MCFVYQDHGQSIEHLFMHCSFSNTIWPFGLIIAASNYVALPTTLHSFLNHWTNLPLKGKAKILWSNIIGAIVWNLCVKNNNRIFQDGDRSSNVLWEDIISMAALWCKISSLFYSYMLLLLGLKLEGFPLSSLFVLFCNMNILSCSSCTIYSY